MLASLIRQLRDQDEPRWTLGRLGTSVPWLFPGQSPARPAVDVLFGVRLHRYGIDARAGRNTAQRWPEPVVRATLSREQVYRLVTQVRQRLSADTLAALGDILDCQPNDLIEVEVVSKQVRKAAGESGRAAQGAVAACSGCGETRPCQRISSGSPICNSCRSRPPRPCFRCGRDRPVQAEGPAGPVCVGCYEHVRRHPAECAGCGVVRPLIGSNEQGRPVCGPCAGAPGLD